MGPVETAVRGRVGPGATLETPTGRGTFKVAEYNARGVVLLLGQKAARTVIPWPALEGVPAFLRSATWTEVGGSFDTTADTGSLDGYLKGYINRATAGWVAALLERAGVIDIDRRRPARVRLRSSANPPSRA